MSYKMLVAPRLVLAVAGASLAVVAACSDNQEPTSPARTVRSYTPSVNDVSSDASKAPPAKPQDQVGFTKLTYMESAIYTAAPGVSEQGWALCPVGSTVASGGYTIMVGNAPVPTVTHSRLITSGAQNGWSVSVSNKAVGAVSVTFYVYAVCAS